MVSPIIAFVVLDFPSSGLLYEIFLPQGPIYSLDFIDFLNKSS